jgi:hypothetical protein
MRYVAYRDEFANFIVRRRMLAKAVESTRKYYDMNFWIQLKSQFPAFLSAWGDIDFFILGVIPPLKF